jgi:N-methylhydantoinase B
MTTTEYDPVTLEIARHRLESIAEEVGAALVRTAYSPNIKDRRDCSAGVYTPAGELVAQAEHIPLHLGLMPEVVRAVLAEVPLARLGPGDAIVTNDPFIGGSHLPDLCVISPVFAGDEPIALVANLAHHVDVGGLSPGSIPVGVTEIYQEGLRIPPVFLAREGEVQHDVVALLLANIRTETVTRGDLTAQLAANALGARRLGELHAAWGAEGLAARQRWLI